MNFSCRCFQPDHYEGAKPLLYTAQEDQSKSTQTADEPYKGLLDLTTSDREASWLDRSKEKEEGKKIRMR